MAASTVSILSVVSQPKLGLEKNLVARRASNSEKLLAQREIYSILILTRHDKVIYYDTKNSDEWYACIPITFF